MKRSWVAVSLVIAAALSVGALPALAGDIVGDIMQRCPSRDYSFEGYLTAVRALQMSPRVSLSTIGASRQGRPLVQVTVRDPETPPECTVRVYLIARQHGTECSGTTASLALLQHFAASEGELERALLRQLTWVVVPVANPDGMVAGRRGNGGGADLNRDWNRRSQPETQAIVRAVEAVRPHAVVDMHELPAHSNKSAFRGNFIQTIGPSRWLPGELTRDCGAASGSVASWMGQLGYPLSIYYDSAGEDRNLCHRYFGLARKIPSYLFEAKTGPGRGLAHRTRFHLLGALVVANNALHTHYDPGVAVPEMAVAPAPAVTVAEGAAETGPLGITLEQPRDRDTARGDMTVLARVTDSPRLAYVQLQVDGVVRALCNAAPHSFPLNTRGYADGEHQLVVQACDDAGRVLSEAQVTVLVDNLREAGE